MHILFDELITEAHKEADFYIEKVQISPLHNCGKRRVQVYQETIEEIPVIFLKRNDEYKNIKNYSDFPTEYTFF